MRKKLIILIITVVFSASSASAALFPLLLAGLPSHIGYSLLAHAVAGAAVWWYNVAGGTKNIKSNSDIISPGKVQWVSLVDGKPMTNQANIKNRVAFSDLQGTVLKDSASKTKYPTLATALEVGTAVTPLSMSSPIGALVSYDGGNYTVGSTYDVNPVPVGNWMFSGGAGSRWSSSTDVEIWGAENSFSSGYRTYRVIRLVAAAAPPKRNATAAEFKASAETSAGSGVLKSSFSGDIDKLISDAPNIVHYEDDTGNDATTQIPSNALSVNAYNDLANAQNVATAATAATTSAQAAATTARNNYINSGGNADTGQGGNAELYQKYLEAKAAADAAAAREAEAAASVNATMPTLPGENVYDSTVEGMPEKKDITSLLQSAVAASPLASVISGFGISITSASPVVSLGNVYGRELTFDFSRYENPMNIAGTMFLIIAHGFAILVVVKGW